MSSVKTYKNPIYRGADPFILTHEGKYYLYATNAAREGYKVAQSDDLVNWEDKGFCLKKGDVKGELVYSADGKWCYGFWAPEVMYYKGKFYMIYTVDNHIGIAEADSPLGPFTQKEHKWIVDSKAIDGSFFVDDDGAVYLYYRHVEKNRLVGVRLSDDLTSADMSTMRVLITPGEFPWEEAEPGVIGTEGPFVLKHDGKYYITYSANDYRCQDYAIGYAVSDSPLGEYKKYAGNPILKRTDKVVGTGHHSFTKSADGKKLLCVYHTHNSLTSVEPRMVCIDYAEFVEKDGETVLVIHGPTTEPVPEC